MNFPEISESSAHLNVKMYASLCLFITVLDCFDAIFSFKSSIKNGCVSIFKEVMCALLRNNITFINGSLWKVYMCVCVFVHIENCNR